jgi:hypothetical protein
VDGGTWKLVLNDRQLQVVSGHQDHRLWVVRFRVPCPWVQVPWLSHTTRSANELGGQGIAPFLSSWTFWAAFLAFFLAFFSASVI